MSQNHSRYLFKIIDKNLATLDSNESLKIRNAINRNISKSEFELLVIDRVDELKYRTNIVVNTDFKKDIELTIYDRNLDAQGNETLVFQDNFYNYAIIVIYDLKIFGFIQIGPDKYYIEPISERYYLLTRVDNEKVSKSNSECKNKPYNKENIFHKTSINEILPSINSLTNYTIDILVAYTPMALNKTGTVQAMNALIDGAIAQANTSYSQSGINISLNVVYKTLLDINESPYYLQIDLDNFIANAQIQTLRLQYGADICVLLLSDANKDNAGLAAGDATQDSPPYCVLRYDYAISQMTFAHEIGHLQGAQHQYFGTDPIDYAHGWYYKDVNPINSWRTIMSVMAGGYGDKWGSTIETRIGRWSDPGNYYSDGHILGASNANNKLKLNNTASFISSLMSEPTTVNGIISNNTTWSGTVNVVGTITINNGVNLSISSGTNIYFVSGAALIVNGSLTATNSLFTSAYNWGGIIFYSGSQANLQYCTIKNAATGINCTNTGSASIQISNCFIQNNSSDGIYLYNSSPLITNNSILSNGSNGINCDTYSSPKINNNTMKWNTYSGLRCNNFSSPAAALTYFGSGNNVIKENQQRGINTSYNCNIYFGSSGGGGSNSIFNNNTYEVSADYGCNVYAQYNWWGINPPPASKFTANQSVIDTLYSLKIDPNPNRAIVFPTETRTTVKNDLNLSIAQINNEHSNPFIENNPDDEIAKYKEIIKKEGNNYKGRTALVMLENAYWKEKKEGFLDFIDKEILSRKEVKDELTVLSYELMNHYYLENKNFNQAISNLEKIKNEMPLNKDIEKYNLFGMGAVYYNCLNDKTNAEKYFNELKQKFPSDGLVQEINNLLKKESYSGNNKNNHNQLSNITKRNSEATHLAGNYPNPFNPSTKISFSIQAKSHIRLKVFDLLGREVVVLAEGFYEPGRYEISFDAGSVKGGLPSGIYFYNLTTENNSVTKKMVLVK